jgi:hypothetical protein
VVRQRTYVVNAALAQALAWESQDLIRAVMKEEL